MGKRKSFWRQFREKMENFILDSMDGIFNWIRGAAKISAEEANMYLGFLIMLGFGVITFLIQEIFPMSVEKRAYFTWTGIAISIGSIAMILIQVARTVLHNLGLLNALIKIRDIILKKFKLDDESKDDKEDQVALPDDVPTDEDQKELLPEKEISTLDFYPISTKKELLPSAVESVEKVRNVATDSKSVVEKVKI